MLLTADFETTTDVDDCRVWAWGVCEIGNPDYFQHGNTIDGFFEYIQGIENSTVYFHNLKFDGEFIFVWLFEHGFRHVTAREDETTKTFTTLISNMGQFYSVKIIFEKRGKKTKSLTIYDSLKILPFTVDKIAKGFNLPVSKLELDYKAERAPGHMLTREEVEYLKNDVEIMARALHVLFEQNLTKMTQGSNALFDYKNTVGKRRFDEWFPLPDDDTGIRGSYKGGFTYLTPEYKDKDIGVGIVLDVNSLYPWVMHDCKLPYGEGHYFVGQYVPDKLYDVYVQSFTCQFELKEGYIPTIQLKNNLSFVPTEYVTTSNNEEITLCLTSVDLELFFKHYDVYNVEYHDGWKFKSATGLFSEYIDKWMKIKIESTLNGNEAMRTLAKLMLNALYGKFALNPKVQSKYPVYNDGAIRYIDGPEETRKPLYIPVGTFITSWARQKTITSAQMMKQHFVYADTDSLHLDIELPPELAVMSNKELSKMTTADLRAHGLNFPDDFEIDPTALGAWKIENKFNRARFLRQKSYIEDENPPETWGTEDYKPELLKITCAGMPKGCYGQVTWENFHEGATYTGKLVPKHVKGGIVLVDTEFTIRKT